MAKKTLETRILENNIKSYSSTSLREIDLWHDDTDSRNYCQVAGGGDVIRIAGSHYAGCLVTPSCEHPRQDCDCQHARQQEGGEVVVQLRQARVETRCGPVAGQNQTCDQDS